MAELADSVDDPDAKAKITARADAEAAKTKPNSSKPEPGDDGPKTAKEAHARCKRFLQEREKYNNQVRQLQASILDHKTKIAEAEKKA